MGATKIHEYHDLCFKVFCQFGGKNREAMIRELKKQGCEITRPTLEAWIKELNMEERLKQADGEKQKVSDSQISFEEKMLLALIQQKEKYEKYFESLPINSMDNQAQFAYANIIKTIIDLSRKLKPKEKETKDPAEMKRLAEEILESEYGIKR